MNYKDIKEINNLINEYYERDLSNGDEDGVFNINDEIPLAYTEDKREGEDEFRELQVSTIIYKKELRFSIDGVLAVKEQYELDEYKKLLKEMTYDNLISSFY